MHTSLIPLCLGSILPLSCSVYFHSVHSTHFLVALPRSTILNDQVPFVTSVNLLSTVSLTSTIHSYLTHWKTGGSYDSSYTSLLPAHYLPFTPRTYSCLLYDFRKISSLSVYILQYLCSSSFPRFPSHVLVSRISRLYLCRSSFTTFNAKFSDII